MAQDRGAGLGEMTTPTSQLIRCLVQSSTHMRLYPLETRLFHLTNLANLDIIISRPVLSTIFGQFFKYWKKFNVSVGPIGSDYASLVQARELKEKKKAVVDCVKQSVTERIESRWIQFHTSYSRDIDDPKGLRLNKKLRFLWFSPAGQDKNDTHRLSLDCYDQPAEE
ncbi:hypothetical protein TNCV_625671 [Trichonephila clavipes]|nr:hypothetical protein TNCV_625671 [Trichonephila clavipes]